MDDPSRVGEARRHVASLCLELGFDAVLTGQAAIIVNELGSNLVKHATGGQLWIGMRAGAVPELEMLSVDDGPGIRNVDQAMQDGFSTAGSPGTGLGAVKRLASDFDLHSEAPSGTVILARLRGGPSPASASAFRHGAIAIPAPGERVCGDGWALATDGARAAVLMADGLGHGEFAAEAAEAAVALFAANPFAELKVAMEDAHAALRMTRGAAVTRAVLDAGDSTLAMAGAGNVALRLVSGVYNRSVLAQNGTVGVQMRRVEETRMSWPDHALVVLHSDGLQSRWPPEAIVPLMARDPSLVAAVLVRDFGRGRDDVTVVVLRRND